MKSPTGAHRDRHMLTVGLLATGAVAFVTNAVIAHLLTRSDFGAVGSVVALAALVAIPLSSIGSAVTRQVVVAEPGAFRLWTFVGGTVTAGGAVILVCFGLIPVLDPLLHLSGDVAVVLLGAYLGAILVEGVPRGVLLGERHYVSIALIVLFGALAKLGLSAAWSALAPSVVSPLGGTAAGEALTALAFVISLRALARPGARNRRLRISDIGLSMAGFTGLLSLMSIDTIAARHFLTGAQSGDYAVASGLGSAAYFVAAAAATAIFPDVAEGVSSDSRRSFLVGLAEVSALAIGAAALLDLEAAPLVRLVYGNRYLGAKTPLIILSLSYALLGILAYLVNHHLAHRSRAIMLSWIGAAILTTAVLLAHRSPTEVAFDALTSSGILAVILGSVSGHLECSPAAPRAG